MLKVENLSFSVNEKGMERNILSDVSFDVKSGEMLVITGPNGGGKSTLAKVIMGIEKATAGKITLDGTDITGYDIDERAKAGIGFAFQQPPRFKGMTVDRLISLAAGEEKSESECCSLLSKVGLCAQEYVKREVDNTLSGGEMKRLEIATVLAKPHKLCIFDEPEAGIDLWSFSMLIQQFEEIKKDKNAPTVVIKGTDESSYKNLIDALDEMQICNISRYAIVDITDGDKFLLDNYEQKGELTRNIDR